MLFKIYLSFSIPLLTPVPPTAPSTADQLCQSKKGDVLNDCLMTVNGTNFRVPQKGMGTKGNAFTSHKYVGKSALCYELGMSILGGDLVWIQGLYPAGKYTDIKILSKVLHHFLDLEEQVKADEGYVGHPDKNQVSPECGESGGEVGDAGEGEGAS
jgi:hypothetical protein